MNSLPYSKRTMGPLAGFAVLAVLAGCLGAGSAQAEEWNKSYTVSGRAHVHVDTNDGSVRVTTGDSKQVEFRVSYNGYTLDKNLSVTSRQDGDQVEVSARIRNSMSWGWGGMHRSLRIEVHMPRTADLNVDMLSELKSAVDDMRLLLWQYIETASEVNPQRVQEGMDSQRLHRVTKFLQLLRKRLAPSSDEQPVSFIERINAAVTEHLGRDKAA